MNTQTETFTNTEAIIGDSTTSKKVANMPTRMAELLAVATRVYESWDETKLPLLWCTRTEFKGYIDEMAKQLASGKSAGATRRQITKELRDTNARINAAAGDLKRLLFIKYKSDYKVYMADAGIKTVGKNYSFPKNQQERILALDMACSFVERNPALTTPELNLTHWQEMRADYIAHVNSAVNKDSSVTESSIKKSKYKENIVKTLNSIIWLIRANYPDSYQQEIRRWGFHKEKY